VQVLVNLEYRDKQTNAITATSHGDLFSIWGAHCTPDRPHPLGWERCLPSENHAKGGGEWNHYVVRANDGVIKLEVNGKEVSGVSKCNPRKGYLALESEGAECHFKNMKIKELPSTNPKPEECAKVAEGFVSLFNGVDLKGWKTEKDAWKVDGEVLKTAGKADLVSEKKFGACEVLFDWKFPPKTDGKLQINLASATVTLAPDGQVTAMRPTFTTPEKATAKTVAKPGGWNRTAIVIDNSLTVRVNGGEVGDWGFAGITPVTALAFTPAEGLQIMNVFVRELKEKK
jgi:hypothetical protein